VGKTPPAYDFDSGSDVVSITALFGSYEIKEAVGDGFILLFCFSVRKGKYFVIPYT